MRKITLLILSITIASFLRAQDNPTFNHLALYVKDLERSVEFYKKILLLKEIPNPVKTADMRWLSLGKNMELHLISMGNNTIQIDTVIHFALAVQNFDKFIKRMTEMNIPFEDTDGKPNTFNIRADGIKQIYFKDPDGYWVEINNSVQKKK